jgi:hypothetical protein
VIEQPGGRRRGRRRRRGRGQEQGGEQETGEDAGQRFFQAGLDPLQRARGSFSVCTSVVSFFTAVVALFCRRLTRAAGALDCGGRPALGERREGEAVFLRVATSMLLTAA